MTFACRLVDADLVRGCAPAQPERVEVGQKWMNPESGSVLPVKTVRGEYVDLGGAYYTVIVTEAMLRRDYVCIDVVADSFEPAPPPPPDSRTPPG